MLNNSDDEQIRSGDNFDDRFCRAALERLQPDRICFWRNLMMLILSLIGFLVIMGALNQAYEGGDENGDV